MYVCMYVCMDVCTVYVCMYVSMYVCIILLLTFPDVPVSGWAHLIIKFWCLASTHTRQGRRFCSDRGREMNQTHKIQTKARSRQTDRAQTAGRIQTEKHTKRQTKGQAQAKTDKQP